MLERNGFLVVATVACIGFGAVAYGCSNDGGDARSADGGVDTGAATASGRATLAPTGLADAGTPSGSVDFEEIDGKVTVRVQMTGATPGPHGMHIHASWSCDANDAGPAGAAGGHWNPADAAHGLPTGPGHHPGDFGNIEIGADGTGTLTFVTTDFSVQPMSPSSALNHAVIFHAGTDDGVTQPSGNSGGRAACGLIVTK